jgi:hypothetical protein
MEKAPETGPFSCPEGHALGRRGTAVVPNSLRFVFRVAICMPGNAGS